jgi:hypothetical protein
MLDSLLLPDDSVVQSPEYLHKTNTFGVCQSQKGPLKCIEASFVFRAMIATDRGPMPSRKTRTGVGSWHFSLGHYPKFVVGECLLDSADCGRSLPSHLRITSERQAFSDHRLKFGPKPEGGIFRPVPHPFAVAMAAAARPEP